MTTRPSEAVRDPVGAEPPPPVDGRAGRGVGACPALGLAFGGAGLLLTIPAAALWARVVEPSAAR